ncbi:MAG: YceI family protein [Saprospiraceae bacterium]|nr:YceI family protein [Saprospiraceae bacterium]
MKHLFLLFLIVSTSLMAVSCKSKGAEENAAETTTTSGSTPQGAAYEIDVPRSELKWNAFKPTGTHFGTVPISGGTIYVDGDLITGGSIEINMTGIEVKDMDGEMKEKLEAHLKGSVPGKEEDFFNVAKYPKATFTILGSNKLENDPLGTHLINGELRIKEITKPVSFKAVVDLTSGVALKATAEPFVIDRTEWDIKFKSKKFFDDLKDDFVNDEIKLELTVGAVKAAQ